MRKTSDRKSKKSRQVVKKKGSRKKSKKVMKGGYGRGKNHKGGAQKLLEFYTTFNFKKYKKEIKIEQVGTTYFLTNPLDLNRYKIVFRQPDKSGNSGYYLEEILSEKADKNNPADIEDLFIQYVRYQKNHQETQGYGENIKTIITNTITKMENKADKHKVNTTYPDVIKELKKVLQ